MKEIKAILADRIFTPTEDIPNGVILIDGHRILKVGPKEKVEIPKSAPVIDNRDRLIVPGFVDMHIHGAGGRDLMEGTAEAIVAVSQFLARHGITSFLATTVTARLDRTLSALEGLTRIIGAAEHSWGSSDQMAGAQPLGIHFEGPRLSLPSGCLERREARRRWRSSLRNYPALSSFCNSFASAGCAWGWATRTQRTTKPRAPLMPGQLTRLIVTMACGRSPIATRELSARCSLTIACARN